MSTILDHSRRMYDPASPITAPTTSPGSSHQNGTTGTNSTSATANSTNSGTGSTTPSSTSSSNSNGGCSTISSGSSTSSSHNNSNSNNNNSHRVWNDSSIECNSSTENLSTFEENNNKRLLSAKLSGRTTSTTTTASTTTSTTANNTKNNLVCHHFSSHARPSTSPQQQSPASLPNHISNKDRLNASSIAKSNGSSSKANKSKKDIVHLPGESSLKSLRKRRLKEAKCDYEARIEQYFQQLTVGCGRADCMNRFCATGKGGIRNLHRQAALVMSIQLASKPESRLCQYHTFYETAPKAQHAWAAEEEDEEEEQHQQPARAKPFLLSLFSSSSFLSLFGMQVDHDQTKNSNNRSGSSSPSSSSSSSNIVEDDNDKNNRSNKSSRRRRRTKRENDELPNKSNQVHDERDGFMGSLCNTNVAPKPENNSNNNKNNNGDNSYYYQLDSMSDTSTTTNSSSYESDTSSEEGMLLAIRPNIITDVQTAIDQVHQMVTEDPQKLSYWCRAVFQNWEGIGNSLLSNGSHLLQPIGLSFQKTELDELALFYRTILGGSGVSSNYDIRTSETVTESLETLLDRMNMNTDGMTSLTTAQDAKSSSCIRTMVEWCRALLAVMEWIRIQQHTEELSSSASSDDSATEGQSEEATFTLSSSSSSAIVATATPFMAAGDMWSGILSHKFIQVVNKIACNRQSVIREVLKQHLARYVCRKKRERERLCFRIYVASTNRNHYTFASHEIILSLDAVRMRSLVTHLHNYLINHFHTGPYKHGEQDSVVMATKFLELAYEANSLSSTASGTIIPTSDFNCEAVCKKLNIKNEYRIWRRVLQYGEGRHSISTIAASRPSSSASQFCGLNEQQRRTRLFLTTTSTSILLPYPFANEYQFSWFSYPFLLPPPVKRKILQLDAMSQMSAEYEDACVNHTLVVHARRLLSDAPRMVRNLETNLKSATCPYLLLEIRREHFVQDTFHQVSRQWVNIKKPLKIKFVGGGEEGMDQGGVQKEFFNVLFEKLMAKPLGLFDTDPDTRLQWMLPVVNNEDSLRTYEMVGVMMGLAIYNGVIMNLQFPQVLWKVLVQPSEARIEALANRHELFTFQDLCEGWPSLAHGLQQLLDWPEDVQDVFCRNYEISLDVFGQGIATWPLQPGGTDVPVTNANRTDFVRDYCTHFLYYAQRDPLLAIRRGLWSVMGGSAMDLCTAQVLEVVACGQRQSAEIDLDELERVTEYDDGYSAEHTTIRHFWSIVHQEMTSEQKRKLLFFVTASDRVPVGGLKELTFVVQRNGPDSDRLPTALTCFSRLLLPEYASREKMSERLITAIENAKGFGLV
ncbi:hypothetical protein BDB00DRAFT_634473 [Zychaea mexicana]|uniref:uncharacterized protein n=1 Tax=Zychaea mexicana TaxID=64656 RepID=UPI0022FE5684|nr:uncharacterized protein BDB00DRAFT_634473 [Zychaea mexicana]KAI9489257.1 hypothetical protein BDB00DRAFT_634473 [Zychaea mexicana]